MEKISTVCAQSCGKTFLSHPTKRDFVKKISFMLQIEIISGDFNQKDTSHVASDPAEAQNVLPKNLAFQS